MTERQIELFEKTVLKYLIDDFPDLKINADFLST